ncbi:hypothetical protein GGE24_005032 [Bradyrhizobium centrosematis]|nr:hypothetical protein [Bradyrhizobium centrosematis]MCS3775693.1 hypothetical protein [Bradyrhizobium centrosematis]
MKFVFIAKHRAIWPVAWLCNALGVSRSGFHAWLNRSPSTRSRSDEELGGKIKDSFMASDRTYGARHVWRDMLADGADCGLHRIERLTRVQGLRARPRRRRLPKDSGDRQFKNVPANLLDRQFAAERPNQKWIADFTYLWTAEGWLCMAAVIDLFSRRVVGWSMSAAMTAQLVTDALLMAVLRRGLAKAVVQAVDFDGVGHVRISLFVGCAIAAGRENSRAAGLSDQSRRLRVQRRVDALTGCAADLFTRPNRPGGCRSSWGRATPSGHPSTEIRGDQRPRRC